MRKQPSGSLGNGGMVLATLYYLQAGFISDNGSVRNGNLVPGRFELTIRTVFEHEISALKIVSGRDRHFFTAVIGLMKRNRARKNKWAGKTE
jgi:hypothetical protein